MHRSIGPALGLIVGILFANPTQVVGQARPAKAELSGWNEETHGPLPRHRLGGTPHDPDQRLTPYAVSLREPRMVPTSGLIESPPEYAPADGVIFRYSSSAWPFVVRDCVVALTQDPAHDEIAYVVVSSSSQETNATNLFTAGGADMSKVDFIIMPNDSIWLRDYGPHFIWQGGAKAIVDSHYYPGRPLDNFIPTMLADDEFHIPSYDIGLYYSGGNFQPDSARNGFITALIHLDNPGFGEAFIAELMMQYQGIDTLHIMPQLPFSVDGTGHIDMWMYLVDEDTVIISEFIPGSNAQAIQITENAVPYFEALGYEVFRTPDSNSGGVHYTYTNAFRVNDRIFIPTYGQGDPAHLARDAQALTAWQNAAGPGVEIVPIDCYSIIPAAGAIHCIVMQVPRYTDPLPAAHVVAPDGGELVVAGTTHDILWTACDDLKIQNVDVLCSTDGGVTFPHVLGAAERNDGHLSATVPSDPSSDAIVKLVAHDSDGNSVEALSEGPFEISGATRHVYDFGINAGVDRWGWGYQTLSWSSLNGVRRPAEAATEMSVLQSGAYGKIATSDAAGSDSDPNRYIAPSSSSGRESTHIFEFTIAENPDLILDIGLLWEGYGDACLQMEMYVWDEVQANWCDGNGLYNENSFMDNFAGNRDERLEGHIRSDFSRYIDASSLVTILLYAERSAQESFHDYVSVTVTYGQVGDMDVNGQVDLGDLPQFVAVLVNLDTDPYRVAAADMDGSGSANGNDIRPFVDALLAP